MYADLPHFLAALDADGELLRVRQPVSPVLEISAMAEVESKARAARPPSTAARAADPGAWDRGGRALLFEQVEGSDFPVLINAFGSYRRMEMALGCHEGGHSPGGFAAIARRIASLTKPKPPRDFSEAWERGRELLPLLRVLPRAVRDAACQQVVISEQDVDLTRLPMLRCWPHDGDFAALGYPPGVNDGVEAVGHPKLSAEEWARAWRGRYITFAGIHTIHREELGQERPSSHNIGMYRVQLIGKRHLAMHWHMHHDGARHWRSWKAAGDRMPVAIVLGGESVMPYAATCPLPPGIGELLMAGFLNRGGIPMVPCKTVPLRVPANAEIVIEGWVSHRAGMPGWDPRDPAAGPLGAGAIFEGPFGDHTGFYSMPDRYPLVEVTAITHRRGAIFPATLVGLPPQEDYYLGKATERVMGALLKIPVHDVEDYDLPMFGAFHNCAVMQIEKAYPTQGRRMMHSVWGTGQMAWTKVVMVVDKDIDVHDTPAVLRRAAERCRPARDLERVVGPVDILDHATPALGVGEKLGFDCTRKWPSEAAHGVAVEADEGRSPGTLAEAGALLSALRALPGVREAHVQEQVPGWLLISVDKGLGEVDRDQLDLTVAEAALNLDPAAHGCGPLPFVLVLGRDVDLHDPVAPFFHWLAGCDFGRDMVLRSEADRVAFACAPKVPGDARRGRGVRAWPPVVSFPEAVLARAKASLPTS
ncbi:MAG: UbiD family decarboxylase [Deltaproteobacteria bacterium]|nr:UbiD family decarboxylase [Deltaproteobacteria bacterium]